MRWPTPELFREQREALWLGDSATLLIVAVFFAAIAARPSMATRPALILVALIPAATAILIYMFVGNFYAGHLLLGASAAALLASVRLPAALRAPSSSD
ncbi:MAG TPA: hypothetical protein VGK04_05155 [Thermoanaerobaculia bacterium]